MKIKYFKSILISILFEQTLQIVGSPAEWPSGDERFYFKRFLINAAVGRVKHEKYAHTDEGKSEDDTVTPPASQR